MADHSEIERRAEVDLPLSRPVADPPAGHALPGGPDLVPATIPTDHPIPARTTAGATAAGSVDPDRAREEIQRTRARMSETIDQIEEQILRRKERLQEQLDIRGQLRNRLSPVADFIDRQPLAAVGGVFALALAVGFLSGGAEEDEPEEPATALEPLEGMPSRQRARGWRGRARRWERRSRELLRRNQLLEEELKELRSRLQRDRGEDEPADGWMGAVAGMVGSLLGRGEDPDVEVELRQGDAGGDYGPSASYDQHAPSYRGREADDPLQG